MREFFTEKQDDRAVQRHHFYPFTILIIAIQHKLAAVRISPSGVQVGYDRQNAINFASEGVVMFFIETFRRVMGKMAFKRKQPEKQPLIQNAL